jgi:hypothetical protein
MNTSSYNLALDIYGDGELERIVAYCATHGVVHADNEVFFCAYPCNKCNIGGGNYKSVDKADTWYVYIAAGNLKRGFQYLQPLPFIAFRRMDEKFRIYEFEKLRRKIWQIR